MDVSVIIPSFNSASSLPKTIASCRGSRCKVEIIVIDDGSTDNTWEWLKTQTDVIARRQANQGQPWAINHGLRLATGKYVRHLDSDDFLEPGIIDRHFEEAEATGADIVYSRVDIYVEASDHTHRFADAPLWDDFMAEHLGEGPGLHLMGMQFRRTLLDNIPARPEYALREDRARILEIGLLKPKFRAVPGCAGYWVIHERQMHASNHGAKALVSAWQLVMVFRVTLKALAEQGELTVRRRKAAAKTLWSFAHMIGYGFAGDAAAVADWVFALDPDFMIPERGAMGWLYRTVGFRRTEAILRVRRSLLGIFKDLPPSSLGKLPS